jgi:hypothetical protein
MKTALMLRNDNFATYFEQRMADASFSLQHRRYSAFTPYKGQSISPLFAASHEKSNVSQ